MTQTLQRAWAAVKNEALNAWYNEGGAAKPADCAAVETALEAALEVERLIEATVDKERAAVIRLIKAHAKAFDARGSMSDIVTAGYFQALVSEIEDAMQHDRAHVEALEARAPYRYRGMRMPNSNAWHVSGADMSPEGGGAGVLEWCHDEADAKMRMGLMARHPQFEELSNGKWED